MGEIQVRKALQEAQGGGLKIVLLHHPFALLREFDRNDSAALLVDNCDFILHGHRHDEGLPVDYDPERGLMIISAGAWHETPPYSHAYNWVRLDLADATSEVYMRRYSPEHGGFQAEDRTLNLSQSHGRLTFPLRLKSSQPVMTLPTSVSVPDRVYLKELRLRNFRCFEEESFPLSEEFTVFVGDNGSGKTALLEALAIGVGAFFQGVYGLRVPRIEPDQVRLRPYRHGPTTTYEPQYPARVSCQGIWGSQELKWACTLREQSESTTDQNAKEIVNLARSLQAQVSKDMDVVLPVIAYYSTGRLWRVPEKRFGDIDRPGSRFRGYADCLDPASHVRGLMQWMKTQELITLQENQPNLVFEAVKDALKNCVEDLQSVSYKIREDDVYAYFSDGSELPFRMLSEGVRNMLAMVADIAHRAAILNPHLRDQAATRTPGIVLIDEIDLHLHPRWQRRVVEDLRRTFPRMQFIAATHSPFIIQSLRPGELVDLAKGPTGEYVNRSIEDIVEEVMGVDLPQRSLRYQRMYEAAQEYYRILQEADGASPERKRELKQKLDELVAPFSDNVAYHAFLEMERLAAGIGEGEDETC